MAPNQTDLPPIPMNLFLNGLFALVVFTLPLRVQWIVQRHQLGAIYYEYLSTIFYLSDAAVLAFILGVIIWYAWKRPISPPLPPQLFLSLGLLAVLTLLSAYWAMAPALAAYLAVRLFVLCGLVITVVLFQPSPRLVQGSVAASLWLQSAVAVTQFARQDDIGWQWLGEMRLVIAAGRSLSLIPVGDELWLRAYGLTPHPNILGGILMVFFLILLPAYLESYGWRKVGWLLCLLAGGVALLLTFSRSAWLGTAVGGGVFMAGIWFKQTWRQQFGRFLFPSLLMAGLLLLIFGYNQRDLLLTRLSSPTSYVETRSLDERQALNAVAFHFIRQQPVLGVGANNFAVAFELLEPPISQQLVGDTVVTFHAVHNIFLLITSELGLTGGMLWLFITLWPPFQTIKQAKNGRLSLWQWSITAVLLALTITDLFDFYTWGWQQGRLLHWFAFALYCLPDREGMSVDDLG